MPGGAIQRHPEKHLYLIVVSVTRCHLLNAIKHSLSFFFDPGALLNVDVLQEAGWWVVVAELDGQSRRIILLYLP